MTICGLEYLTCSCNFLLQQSRFAYKAILLSRVIYAPGPYTTSRKAYLYLSCHFRVLVGVVCTDTFFQVVIDIGTVLQHVHILPCHQTLFAIFKQAITSTTHDISLVHITNTKPRRQPSRRDVSLVITS